MSDRIYTLVDAGQALGVGRQVVAGLVAALGITTKPVPRNGAAKGLDEADMRRLRKALNLPTRNRRTQGQPS